jgi:hypothetical protein
MLSQALLKMIIDLGIHQTTENYERAMGSHVLKREDTSWCEEFTYKKLFRKRFQLG